MVFIDRPKYYERYEQRYQAAYKAGAERWGHEPGNKDLIRILTAWVNHHHLRGRKVVEFACGEGAEGLILSQLGCIYHGIDIAPSAVGRAKVLLKDYPEARVSFLDMVEFRLSDRYDAALDVMGLHMLVTDQDRKKYLKNAYASLNSGATMLFYKELYCNTPYDGRVGSVGQWAYITGMNYSVPQPRVVKVGDREVELHLPFLPARCRNEAQYRLEIENAGFVIDRFIIENTADDNVSASILAHKP